MVMRARVVLRIKQVEHGDDDDGEGEYGDHGEVDDEEEDEEDDDEEDEEDDDDEEEEEEEDDHQNVAGAGQTVVYWCGDCCQVISNRIFFNQIYLFVQISLVICG